MTLLRFSMLFLAGCISTSASFTGISGHADFASGVSSTTCVMSGSVTAGNVEILAVQANGGTIVGNTVTSTRATWTLILNDCCEEYLYKGVVTSTGSESITFTLGSGVALTGSACAEYTTQLFNDSGKGTPSATVSAIAGTDVVAFVTTGGGGPVASAPLVHREYISLGGTHFCELADQPAATTGSYTSTFNTGNVYAVGSLSPNSSGVPFVASNRKKRNRRNT